MVQYQQDGGGRDRGIGKVKIRGGNGSDDNIIMSLTGYAHAACTWLGGKKKKRFIVGRST